MKLLYRLLFVFIVTSSQTAYSMQRYCTQAPSARTFADYQAELATLWIKKESPPSKSRSLSKHAYSSFAAKNKSISSHATRATTRRTSEEISLTTAGKILIVINAPTSQIKSSTSTKRQLKTYKSITPESLEKNKRIIDEIIKNSNETNQVQEQ